MTLDPDPIDKHVGKRMLLRRREIAFSQTKVANALGVTFQQIQKYEKGTNRIAASRLYKLAEILGVPITFFFDGLQRPKHRNSSHR
ncbi:MAG: helix-turn-helix transcriptional regulator [Xanthobacteraceae bacterium]|jgi:transcriptional regulator with XRE-family HTH domain